MIPTPLVVQYKALVGQALMHSLHCPPTQVNLLTEILPSSKSSFTPVGSKSSCRRFFFAFSSVFSDSKPNMSKAEESLFGTFETSLNFVISKERLYELLITYPSIAEFYHTMWLSRW